MPQEVLTAEINDLQEAGNPKEARAPNGCKVGSLLIQISTTARLINFPRNCKYHVHKETPSVQHISTEHGSPSNKIEVGLYPGPWSFCHWGQTHVDEGHIGRNLKNEPFLPISNDWLPSTADTWDDKTQLENIHPEDCTSHRLIMLKHWPPYTCSNEEDKLFCI